MRAPKVCHIYALLLRQCSADASVQLQALAGMQVLHLRRKKLFDTSGADLRARIVHKHTSVHALCVNIGGPQCI